MDLSAINYPAPQGTGSARSGQQDPLRDAAKQLEQTFVAEMLRSSGYGKVSEHWGGGVGEEHFSSYLVDIQARNIVESGGFGLAEQIYEKLKETE